jgi:hypothetical protein
MEVKMYGDGKVKDKPNAIGLRIYGLCLVEAFFLTTTRMIAANETPSDVQAAVIGIASVNPCVSAYDMPYQDWAAGMAKLHGASFVGSTSRHGYACAMR